MRAKADKGRSLSRAAIVAVLLLFLAGGLLYTSHPVLLAAAGRYLAPAGEGKAEVVILEGEEMIRERAVRVGMALVESGRAGSLVVVHQEAAEDATFGKPPDYSRFLAEKIAELGLGRDRVKVFSVPQEHPITLNEARAVLSRLSGENIRSAILVARDFHSRRSYWAYKQAGSPLGITVIPHPYFTRFQTDGWWRGAWGRRNFLEEAAKFLYYVFRGYIPLRSLVAT